MTKAMLAKKILSKIETENNPAALLASKSESSDIKITHTES
jgi:hypothetical protein